MPEDTHAQYSQLQAHCTILWEPGIIGSILHERLESRNEEAWIEEGRVWPAFATISVGYSRRDATRPPAMPPTIFSPWAIL
jgi:hypothetical protein